MKTVLQYLMDSFDAYHLESQNDSITIEKLKEVITKKNLAKEKEQIIEAFNQGLYSQMGNKIKYQDGEQYYNEIFKPIN